MSGGRVFLCSGNGEVRFVNIAIENILYGIKSGGGSPLLVNLGATPFTMGPVKAKQREDILPYFDYFTGTDIPSVQYQGLLALLTDTRKRRILIAAEQEFTDVFLYAMSTPLEESFGLADELILFVKKDASSMSWVYNIVKKVLEKQQKTIIHIVVISADYLDEAAVFFFHLREEIYALLGQNVKVVFCGFINLDIDYINASLGAGRTVVEFFTGGRFHGLITYILRNLKKNAEILNEETFFSRLMVLTEKK